MKSTIYTIPRENCKRYLSALDDVYRYVGDMTAMVVDVPVGRWVIYAVAYWTILVEGMLVAAIIAARSMLDMVVNREATVTICITGVSPEG